ncbi:MAG: high-potential iron-sulfur protein [Myxococcales bacterium]|nr:high-potential iron-sulfur protein [Myxococcales bacterium]
MSKQESTLTRREILGGALKLAVIGALPIGVAGCSSKKQALNCMDTSGLDQSAVAMRNNLKYTDHSPFGTQKDCNNCQFFTAAGSDACGSCTILKGPIAPTGHCTSWAKKA